MHICSANALTQQNSECKSSIVNNQSVQFNFIKIKAKMFQRLRELIKKDTLRSFPAMLFWGLCLFLGFNTK